MDDLGHHDDRITLVRAQRGYMDEPNVPALCRCSRTRRSSSTTTTCTYFLNTIEVRRSKNPRMAQWRKDFFLATSRLTADAAEHFRLPRDQTVITGSRIEL